MELPCIKCRSLYTNNQKPWRFELTEPVSIQLSNGARLIIPPGYITDFATVPRMLRGIVWGAGNHNLATLIHDWLYDTQFSITGRKDWKKDRLFADKEMLYWLKKSDVSWIKRQIMYWAVRLGGKKWFRN